MTYEQALAINTAARKSGTLRFNEAQKAEFKAARDVMHEYSMANDSSYRRQYIQMYTSLAVGTGRMDLVGKH